MRGISFLRFPSPLAVYVVIAIAGQASIPTASAAVADRIGTAISAGSKVQIPDSVHPRIRLASDLGPADANTRLQSLSVRFTMTADQQAALDQLLIDQQNPASSRYHQWLTPGQYAAEFGLSPADIAKVTAWLTSQGFTVTGVAKGASFITFAGTVAQAEAAFGTSIHNVSYNGETHFANVTNASIPSALANVVGAVTGLNNFRFKAHVHTSVVNPNFTSSVSGGHFLAPGDIYTIYDMNPLLKTYNGSGITIAVTGQVDINLADIAQFRSAAGLTPNAPTVVVEGTDPGPALTCNNCYPNDSDLDESSIDLEWSGAMAPAATILFVNGQDVMLNSMTQAIDQDLAPIVTTSYGACEASWGSTTLNSMNQLFEQANAQGQTVIAAAADVGATDCDAGPSATQGLTVDFPGSSPYVTSIGGTQFNGDAAATGSGTTWAATQYWAGTAGSDVISSALGYIPEAVWNDISAGSFGGGGGGASGFFPKPAWQTGTGVPADAARDVPDISLDASDLHDSFLYCVSVAAGASCTSGFRLANNNLTAAGGTSFDAQLFGGMLALIEQKIGARIGNANPVIYALANSSAYYTPGVTVLTNPNVVFNDITTGTNAMPCTAGSVNCPTGGSIGYSAASGYDQATGWGTINLANLANAWTLVKPLSSGTNGTATSTTTIAASPTSVAAGANVTLTATVTGTSGTPTGTVQFLVNGAVVGSGTLNSSGIASYTYATSCANLALLTPHLLPPANGGVQYAGANPAAPLERHVSWLGAGSSASIACFLFIALPRKRRLGTLFLAILSVAIVAGATGCGGGGAVVNLNNTGSGTGTGTSSVTNGSLVVSASYSGNSLYAGSIGSGISAAGFTTATSQVTPVQVTVTVGTCTSI